MFFPTEMICYKALKLLLLSFLPLTLMGCTTTRSSLAASRTLSLLSRKMLQNHCIWMKTSRSSFQSMVCYGKKYIYHLKQWFSTQITPRPVFYPRLIIFGHWTAKNSLLKLILPSSLPPSFQHKRFDVFIRSYA